MGETKRGTGLTIMAVLFVVLAIEDILKPFRLEGPTTGLVFFGTRLSGTADAVMGPVLGIILLIYAAGIWGTRRYAMYLGFAYAIYVTINLALFTIRNPPPPTQGEVIFGVVYSILALLLSWATAIALSRTELA